MGSAASPPRLRPAALPPASVSPGSSVPTLSPAAGGPWGQGDPGRGGLQDAAAATAVLLAGPPARAASSFPAPPVSHGDVSPAEPAAISGSAKSLVQLVRWPRHTALGGPQGRLPPLRRGVVCTAAALGCPEVGASPRPCRPKGSLPRLQILPSIISSPVGCGIYFFFSFPPPTPFPPVPLAGATPRGLPSAGDIQPAAAPQPAPASPSSGERHGSSELVATWGCVPPQDDVLAQPEGRGLRLGGDRGGGSGLCLQLRWGLGAGTGPKFPLPVLPVCCRGPVPCFS